MVSIFEKKEFSPQADSVNNFKIGLESYLKKSPYQEQFSITKSGHLSFHWADWKHTCELQKEILKKFPSLQMRKQQLVESVELMKTYPAWLNNGQKTKKLSLYDIYTSFLDPRMRILFFENKGNQLLLSLSGKNGPYYALKSMNWYDKEIHLSFLYHKLLEENTAMRDFRLRMKFPAEIATDKHMKSPAKVKLCQVTRNGLLFEAPIRLKPQMENLITLRRDFHLNLNLGFFDSLINAGNYTLISKFESVPSEIGHILGRGEKLLVDGHFINIDPHKNYGNTFHFFVNFDGINSGRTLYQPVEVLRGFLESTEEKFVREIKEIPHLQLTGVAA